MNTTTNAKYRILSLALAVCLLLAMVVCLPGPVTANAADGTATLGKSDDAQGASDSEFGPVLYGKMPASQGVALGSSVYATASSDSHTAINLANRGTAVILGYELDGSSLIEAKYILVNTTDYLPPTISYTAGDAPFRNVSEDGTYFIHWLVSTASESTDSSTGTRPGGGDPYFGPYTVKVSRPTVGITTSSDIVNADRFTATLTFSEPISGLDSDDILVLDSKGTVSNLRQTAPNNGTTFLVDIKPNTDVLNTGDTITIHLPADCAVDSFQNGNSAGSKNLTFNKGVPEINWSFEQGEVFTAVPGSVELFIDANGRNPDGTANNVLYVGGMPLNNGNVTAQVRNFLHLNGGTAYTASFSNGQLTITPAAPFTDNTDYTLSVYAGNQLHNINNNYLELDERHFEIRIPTVTGIRAEHADMGSQGGDNTITVTGRNLNHAGSVEVEINGTRYAAVPEANGAAATYRASIPANWDSDPTTYTITAWLDGSATTYATTVETAGAVPSAAILAADQTGHDSAGGQTVFTLYGANLHLYNSLRLVEFKNGAASGRIIHFTGITQGASSASCTVLFPPNASFTSADTYTFVLMADAVSLEHWQTVIVEAATPDPEYRLTVRVGGGGTVSTSGGVYREGERIPITAIPSEGWLFVGWSVDNGGLEDKSSPATIFTMPAGDANVLASFTESSDPSPGPDGPDPEIPGSSSSSRDRSSGGSSTPDSRVAKKQLPASAFSWDSDRTLTIDHERITPLGLLTVQWDGEALTLGTEFSVYEGSVIVRFDADFMVAQSPGDHTVRVEFLNHTGETTVTVGQTAATEEPAGHPDNDTHNPNTGGYPDGGYSGTDNPNTGDGRGVWFALLLGSMVAAALVKLRTRLEVK